MTQQFHSQVYIRKKQEHKFEKIYAPQCSLQHYLQLPRYGSNLMPTNRWMHKEDVIITHTHTHTHTMEHYWAIKEMKFCHFQQDGLGCHHAKWNKSDRERQVLYDITYIWNQKNTTNQPVDVTKKKQSHRYRERTSGYQWGEGRRKVQYRGRELRLLKTIRYKTRYKDILYKMGNIANILK